MENHAVHMDEIDAIVTNSSLVGDIEVDIDCNESESPETKREELAEVATDTDAVIEKENDEMEMPPKDVKTKKRRSIFRKVKKVKVPKDDVIVAEPIAEDNSKINETVEDVPMEIEEGCKVEENPEKEVEEEKSHEKEIAEEKPHEKGAKVRKSLFRKSKKEKLNASFAEANDVIEDDNDKKDRTVENVSIELIDEVKGDEHQEKVIVEEKSHKEGKFKKSLFRKSKKEKLNASFTEPNDDVSGEANKEIVKGNVSTELQSESKVEEQLEEVKVEEVKSHGKEMKLKNLWKRKSSKKVDVVEGESISTQTPTEIIRENPFEEANNVAEEDVLIPEETVDENAEKEATPIKPPRKKSFINRLKKFNKANKSTDTNEEKNITLENSRMEKSGEVTDNGEQDDSFHDVFEDKEKNEIENGEEIHDISDGGIYAGAIENVTVADECPEGNSSFTEINNESNESDLTIVTALPDECNVENTKGDVSTAETETIPQDPEMIPFEISEDAVAISENKTLLEHTKEGETSRQKNTVEEPKVLDYVLIDHLNDKQKEESNFLAIKALKVYRKAQINNAYCQACCNVM